jgi:hypothetical protein
MGNTGQREGFTAHRNLLRNWLFGRQNDQRKKKGGGAMKRSSTRIREIQISDAVFDRYINEVWTATSALDEIAKNLCNHEDHKEDSALKLIHRTRVLVDDAFAEQKQDRGLFGKKLWTADDVSTYETAFEPLRAFINLLGRSEIYGGDCDNGFWCIMHVAVLLDRTVSDGISLFRSRLMKPVLDETLN